MFNRLQKSVPDIHEIRISNYFEYNNVIVQVNGINHTFNEDTIIVSKTGSYFSCSCSRWDLKTIPLTDSLLETIGFKIEKTINQNISIRKIAGEYRLFAKSHYHQSEIDIRNIDYVNRLQNLVYDLTGTFLSFPPIATACVPSN